MLSVEHHLEFLSLQKGCTGVSAPTHVKMPHCWKLHVTAHMEFSMITLSALAITSIMHAMYIVQYVSFYGTLANSAEPGLDNMLNGIVL